RVVAAETNSPMTAKSRWRCPRPPPLSRRSFRGGDSEKPQPRAMAPSESLNREGRRRAGAEPNDHAILDQVDRRFRRRALEGVSVGIGRECRRAQWLSQLRAGASADCRNSRLVVL